MPRHKGYREHGRVQAVGSPRFGHQRVHQPLVAFWQHVLRVLFRKDNDQERQIGEPSKASRDFDDFGSGALLSLSREPADAESSPDGYRRATAGENASTRDRTSVERSVSRSAVADSASLARPGELSTVKSSAHFEDEELTGMPPSVPRRDSDTSVGQSATSSGVADSFEAGRYKAKGEAVHATAPIALLERLDNLSQRVGILELLQSTSPVATATTKVTAARLSRSLSSSAEIRRGDSASASIRKTDSANVDPADPGFQGSDLALPRANVVRTQGFGPQDFDPLTERINERVLFDRGLTLE